MKIQKNAKYSYEAYGITEENGYIKNPDLCLKKVWKCDTLLDAGVALEIM